MSNNNISRRDVLSAASLISAAGMLGLPSGGALAALASEAGSARDAKAEFDILTPHQARQIEAMTARIIPTTDTPGAKEAGVVYFFDSILDKQMAGMKAPLLGGLAEVDAQIEERHPGQTFADFEPAMQDEMLKTIEEGQFFGMLRMLTVFGFFAMEKHGGNKDHLSWKLINFEGHKGAVLYPFGYYDAQVHGARDE